MLAAVAAGLVAVQLPADSGSALYQAWCQSCHGADGAGTPRATTHLEVPPADLKNCKSSTAEPESRWVGIVAHGGAAFGLSLDMPAFGDAATLEQLRAVVRYARSLCGEPGWPPGELNFPRAFLVEKAYPEDEVIVTAQGPGQQFIYEHRLGKRGQVEASARSAFDGQPNTFAGVTGALKYNFWYRLERRALASVGLEVTPTLGRQTLWEVEPFFAFGASLARALFVQGEIVSTWEETAGIAAFHYRLDVARQIGRLAPRVEAEWSVPVAGTHTLSFYPQIGAQLSRLGHVAASLGAELPAVGPAPRHPRLIGFVLWDYGDAPLLRGW